MKQSTWHSAVGRLGLAVLCGAVFLITSNSVWAQGSIHFYNRSAAHALRRQQQLHQRQHQLHQQLHHYQRRPTGGSIRFHSSYHSSRPPVRINLGPGGVWGNRVVTRYPSYPTHRSLYGHSYHLHQLPYGYRTMMLSNSSYHYYTRVPHQATVQVYGGATYYVYNNSVWLRPYWYNNQTVYLAVNRPY